MSHPLRRFASRLSLGALALTIIGASLLAPIRSQASSSHDSASLVVWADVSRAAGFQLYQKEHPNVHMKIVTLAAGDIPVKIKLANRIRSGWPDVVFNEPYYTAQFVSEGYSAQLDTMVPKKVQAGFAANALGGCTYGGHLYCLRNDVAQVVLWYNAKLMKRFGYKVPTTWEQFEALGLNVAKRHPGYVVGNFGDFYSLEGWYWGSGCPLAQLQGASTVHININDPACTRVTKMVDTLLAARALSKEDSFGTGYAKIGQEDKILMMPAASWYPTFLFKPSYKMPSGEIAAAPPLRWSHDKINWTGAQGGGVYTVSSHSTNLRAAAAVATWMATSNDYQGTSLTFPAYLPAADVWAKQLNHNPFFAINPYPVLRESANLIRPTWNYVRYDLHDPFTTTVIAAVENGKTAASAMRSFQARLVQAAQQVGYTVVQ